MKRSWCGKMSLTAVALLLLANSAVQADEVRQFVVIRETGKAERHCLIERSTPKPNGDTLYDVRDLATGQTFQVLDQRVIKTAGPLVIQAAFTATSQRDAEMIAALAASPFAGFTTQKHVPTLAEQAHGGPAIPRLGLFRVLEKKP